MPVYTCTTTTSTLTADIKSALAKEISRIHAEMNHVPSTYVNVVFHELAPGGIYTDGVPANPVLVNGWVRSGHPTDKTSLLATEIAAAVSGSSILPPTGFSWRSKTARRVARSKAAVSCPSPARSRPGSPRNDKWLERLR